MSSANSIKSILASWAEFDIKKVQHELDDNVIEIAQKLEQGDASRKALIESTKEFRKNLTDEQRKLVGPIFKQFQAEVDGSNKRSKFMEQVLLGLYKNIIDLPDPNPALESAEAKFKKIEKIQDLEIENKQLKNTLDEYHAEFAEVKNQEVTIKALKERIKELEASVEMQVQQKWRDREKELQKSFEEKEVGLRENQMDLIKKLGEAELKSLEMKAQVDKCQTELYESKQRWDEVLNAKTCEMDMLLVDLDKFTERAVSAERLVEQLQKSIEASSTEAVVMKNESELSSQKLDELKLSSYRVSSLEVELCAKDKEISQLVEDVQKLHVKGNRARELWESQRTQIEERLFKREKQLQDLEAELARKADYEEVKRELNVLKMIEFSESGHGDQPLEILLLEKNRLLINENTGVKNKCSELSEQLDFITKDHINLKSTNKRLEALVAELEKDLDKMSRTASDPDTINLSKTVNLLKQQQQQQQSIVLNLESPQETSLNLINDLANNPSEDSSLFKIISSQRERFKIRCQELESDNIAAKQHHTFLTNELDKLRSDNLKLYEKVRYLQSVGGRSRSDKYKQSDIEYDADNDETILNKYNNDYESRLDPFSKFHLNEKKRRYTNLKLHDKFTLNLGKFILSNSTSRLIFCLYVLIVHLLIFFNLYHMAHHTSSNRDLSAQCAHEYKNHMAKVHGNSDFHFD